jgi:hypothetical protein
MNPLRFLLCAIVVAASFALFADKASAISTQQAQRMIYILVNVTPGPYGYVPPNELLSPNAGRFGRGSSSFVDALPPATSTQVVGATQGAMRVEASVTPDPTASILYTNTTTVTLNAQAGGASAIVPCAFTVGLKAARTPWTLKSGLASDFSNGSGATFPGTDLFFDTYGAADPPGPAPGPATGPWTAYTVYTSASGNNSWYTLGSSSVTPYKWCVDLKLTVPVNVISGVYSTNAVYTLYY